MGGAWVCVLAGVTLLDEGFLPRGAASAMSNSGRRGGILHIGIMSCHCHALPCRGKQDDHAGRRSAAPSVGPRRDRLVAASVHRAAWSGRMRCATSLRLTHPSPRTRLLYALPHHNPPPRVPPPLHSTGA